MRKALVSLLVVAMVLGLVGTSFAAYTDTAKDAAAKYIDMASGFTWMKGYPDGSFKPAGNITRAEVAAVVVRALGLEAAAASTSGLATKFKDVSATHWAAGYINVATNKGVIKGYPDGTFKPEANVSNAEVITMVVRALNREVDAVGEWPVGHISVAASESIIGSGFASAALATRAQVATYFSKAADVVHKTLTTNGWIIPTDAASIKTFVKYNNLTKVRGLVDNTDVTNKTVTISGDNAGTYPMDAAGIVAGGVSLLDLKGYTVDLYKDNDTGKVKLIETVSSVTSKSGTVRSVGKDYLYLTDDATKYTVGLNTAAGAAAGSLNVTVVRNNVTMMTKATASGDLIVTGGIAVDDEITVFVGDDGNVNYIRDRQYSTKRTIVLSTYTAGTPYSISLKSGGTLTLATDAKVELNGAEVPFASIKKDMIVSVAKDASNYITIVNASDKVVKGKVTGERTTSAEDGDRWYVSIDGVEYRLESNCEVKDGAEITAAAVLGKLSTGDEVSLYLSQRGRGRVAEVTQSTAEVGKVVSFITGTGSYDKWVLDIKGTQTTFEVAKNGDTSRHTELLAFTDDPLDPRAAPNKIRIQGVKGGDYVKIVKDTDGRLTTGTVKVFANYTDYAAVGPLAANGSRNVYEVYGTDKLVTFNDGGTSPLLATSSTAVYVDGMPGEFASISKDYKVRVSMVDGDLLKIKAILVDTSAKMDTNSIVSDAGSVVYGVTNATEALSKVEFYQDADFDAKVAGAATKLPFLVDLLAWGKTGTYIQEKAMAAGVYALDAGDATKLAATVNAQNKTSFISDNAAGSTWYGAGAFRVQLKTNPAAGGLAASTLGAAGTTQTVYMRVTDKFGNVTSAPITIRN